MRISIHLSMLISNILRQMYMSIYASNNCLRHLATPFSTSSFNTSPFLLNSNRAIEVYIRIIKKAQMRISLTYSILSFNIHRHLYMSYQSRLHCSLQATGILGWVGGIVPCSSANAILTSTSQHYSDSDCRTLFRVATCQPSRESTEIVLGFEIIGLNTFDSVLSNTRGSIPRAIPHMYYFPFSVSLKWYSFQGSTIKSGFCACSNDSNY